MTTEKARGGEITIKQPLHLQIMLVDPATGHALHSELLENVQPGDVVRWQYPSEGLRVSLD